VGVAVATALPWARSGRRAVSGYDLVGIARRFALIDGTALRVAAVAWLCLPLAAGASVALVALGRPRAAAVTASAAALAGLVVATSVVKVAQGSSAIGAPLTIVSSVLALAGAYLGLAHLPRRT
jgi:hypothetical protein